MLAALVVLWGSAYAMVRVALDTIPPFVTASGRMFIGAAFLIPLIYVRGLHFPSLKGVGSDPAVRSQWAWLVLLALTANALPFSLISWGQTSVDTGLASVLVAIAPLVTLITAHLSFADERISVASASSVALGFLGICILVGPQAFGQLGAQSSLLSQLAIMMAGVSYGVSFVIARKVPGLDPLVAGAALTLTATLLLLPITLVQPTTWTFSPSTTSLLALILLGVLPTGLANFLFLRATRQAGSTFVAQVNYLVPIWAVALGVIVFGESITGTMLIGILLVVGAVALSGWTRSDGPKDHATSGK